MADADGVKRGAAEAERHLEHLRAVGSATMLGVGKLGVAMAGVFGVHQAIEWGKEIVAAGSDVDEQMSKVGVVFGKSAKGVQDWSSQLADSFGLSQREALTFAGTFGNLLTPMGFAQDKAAKMSGQMVQLAGDMASFNNASIAETLQAIQSGLVGESEPLRRFGVMLNDARLRQEALKLGIYEGTGVLSAQQKAFATYSLILKDTKDAQGDFGRTSGGLANQMRILQAHLQDAAAAVGKALLPAVKQVVSAFNDMVAWVREHWPEIARAIKPVLDEVKAAVNQFIGLVRAIWNRWGNEIVETVRDAWDTVKRVVTDALDIVRGIFKTITDVIHGDWGAAWGDVKGIVKSALDGVWELLQGAVRSLGEVALDIGKAIGTGILTGLEDLGIGLVKLIVFPFNEVIKAVNSAIDKINSVTGNIPFVGGALSLPNIPEIPTPGFAGLGGGGGDSPSSIATQFTSSQLGAASTLLLSAVQGTAGGAAGGGYGAIAPGAISGTPSNQRVSSRGGTASRKHSLDLKPAISFAQSQLGKPYKWSAGHSYGVHQAYDCSGFASNVAMRIPGYTGGIGTTYALIASGTKAKGDEPVLFGFSEFGARGHEGPGHMGIKLESTWYQAGGGSVHTGGAWKEVRVPAGLARILAQDALQVQGGPAPPAPTEGEQRLMDLRAVFGRRAETVGREVVGALGATSGLETALAGMERAGRTMVLRAGQRAWSQTAGVDAQLRSADRQIKEDRARLEILQGERAKVAGALARLAARAAQIQRELKQAAKAMSNPRQAGAATRARRLLLQTLANVHGQQDAAKARRDDLDYQILELTGPGGTLESDQEDIDNIRKELAGAREDGAGSATPASDATSTAAAAPTPDPMTQALLEQAVAQATANARAAYAGAAFINAALGPGDIGGRGGSAWGAAQVINVNTLHPGDPATLAAIAAAANAGNSLGGYIPATSGSAGI